MKNQFVWILFEMEFHWIHKLLILPQIIWLKRKNIENGQEKLNTNNPLLWGFPTPKEELPDMVIDLCKRYFHPVKLKNDPDIERKIIRIGLIIDGRVPGILPLEDIHEAIVKHDTGL